MKKIFTLMLGLAALSAQAVTLTFYVGGKAVTPGSTVCFTDYEAEEYETGVWDITMDPKVSIESDFFTNNVTVTAECTSGQTIQMCAGGACEKGTSVTKQNLTISRGEKLGLQFEYRNGEYEGEAVPDVTTKFTAQNGSDAPIEFTLVMGPNATAIDRVAADGNTVVSTAAGIEYNVADKSAFALYSTTGARVLTATLSGRGTLATASLAKGLYVYTLGQTAGKLIVK